MAEHLDRHQLAEIGSFLNELAAFAGYDSTAQWARESGTQRPNVGNARNGKAGISGYNLLRLIRAAAVRAGVSPAEAAVRASARSGDASAVAGLAGPLESLADALALLEQGQREILGRLPASGEAGRTRPGDAPKRTPARS